MKECKLACDTIQQGKIIPTDIHSSDKDNYSQRIFDTLV